MALTSLAILLAFSLLTWYTHGKPETKLGLQPTDNSKREEPQKKKSEHLKLMLAHLERNISKFKSVRQGPTLSLAAYYELYLTVA